MDGEPRAVDPGFGQSDPTDSRERLDWESKYPPAARLSIRNEAIYLGTLLFSVPIVMLVLWLGWPQDWTGIQESRYRVILKFALAWEAGTLGGVIYDLKWLYHSVARQLWHLDRRLWRIFTPHISGGLAFSVLALVESNLLRVFDSTVTNRSVTVVGICFLIGYFSDSSIAKLSEVAETLFGTTRSKEKHRDTIPTAAGGPPQR
jgi:hypothetical protein